MRIDFAAAFNSLVDRLRQCRSQSGKSQSRMFGDVTADAGKLLIAFIEAGHIGLDISGIRPDDDLQPAFKRTAYQLAFVTVMELLELSDIPDLPQNINCFPAHKPKRGHDGKLHAGFAGVSGSAAERIEKSIVVMDWLASEAGKVKKRRRKTGNPAHRPGPTKKEKEQDAKIYERWNEAYSSGKCTSKAKFAAQLNLSDGTRLSVKYVEAAIERHRKRR